MFYWGIISILSHTSLTQHYFSSLIIINKTVNILKTKHEIYKVTVQVEEYNPFMENCKACDQL